MVCCCMIVGMRKRSCCCCWKWFVYSCAVVGGVIFGVEMVNDLLRTQERRKIWLAFIFCTIGTKI